MLPTTRSRMNTTMRINTNVAALNAQKNLFGSQRALDSSMSKLSSGLRISRAGDDAAGLAIANQLRASTRALKVATNNAEQGNAVLQIAEGSLSTIQQILERAKELVMQKDSFQNQGDEAQANIDAELDALGEEITRIIDTTKFQGQEIFGQAMTFIVSETGDDIEISIEFADPSLSSGPRYIEDIEDMIADLAESMGTVGSAQNRLEFTITNLKNAIVNQSAAESVIRDVDMAEEMANFTKNNILQQAGTAMLAQANQSSQSVLQLLRG
jgi:flagellin